MGPATACGSKALDREGCLRSYDEEVVPARRELDRTRTREASDEAVAVLRRWADDHPECTQH
jgi:hypothetical protein